MVAEQLEARGIRDPELLRAFGTVERHLFVDDDEPYGDHALPVGSGQTISQPFVVALMTAVARPEDGWLDASGPGGRHRLRLPGGHPRRPWCAPVDDRAPSVAGRDARETASPAPGYADRVTVVIGDGTQGLAARAPYRSILVTAGGPSVPTPLLEQLDRGRWTAGDAGRVTGITRT